MAETLYLPKSMVIIKEKILLIITETHPDIFLPFLDRFQLSYKVEIIKSQDNFVLHKIVVRNREKSFYDKFIEKLKEKDIRNLPPQPLK